MIQYSNFLIKREQSRAGSRFAECEKSRLKAKILMTLALLLTAVTGAWATDYNPLTNGLVLHVGDTFTPDKTYYLPSYNWDFGTGVAPYKLVRVNATPPEFTFGDPVIEEAADGKYYAFYVNGWGSYNLRYTPEKEINGLGEYVFEATATSDGLTVTLNGDFVTFAVHEGPAEPPLTVAWNASAKTGTFQMPGSDVVLTPLYAPTAKWDVVETVEQRPAALEGIIAGQDEAIVTPGQSAQGTVMYAVTTTADAAPALDAFSATVPTAKTYDDATTLYVWYYIQGDDTPDGQQPTEENTFNDSEISTTPLTVQVLTNKFDIQFTAANDNTIQAGKATVTVDGQPATLTDGKLQGVKMGTEVKMTAQPGYKFRKVEVKKGGGDTGKPLAEATVGMIIGSNGKAYAADDKDNLPSGVTPEALVCYVSDGHGLALALTDEGEMNWSTAQTTCAAHTPAITGGTWKLASKDEWNNMITAAGSPDALRDGFSSVGGTNMQSRYWSSTESDSSRAWLYSFSSGWKKETKDSSTGNYARACLAF